MVESTTRMSPEEEPLNASQETVFKVKFGNVDIFKKVIGSFSRLTDDMVLEVREDQLTITAYKPLGSVYAKVRFTPEEVLEFECSEKITLSFSLKKFNKILKRSERIAETLTLQYIQNTPSLSITIEKLYKDKAEIDPTFSLNLYSELPEIPPETSFTQSAFGPSFKIDWKEMYASLPDARIYNEIATLQFINNSFSISSSSEIGESFTTFHSPELNEEIPTSFESDYKIGLLKKMLSLYTRIENAQICFSNNGYLKFYGELENGSGFVCCLRTEEREIEEDNDNEEQDVELTEENILEMFKDRGDHPPKKTSLPRERTYLKPTKSINPENFLAEFKDSHREPKHHIQTNFTNSLNTVKSKVSTKKTKIRKEIKAKCIDKFKDSSST
ncbi:MAG: hypothetical protein EU548_06900 [Promethearchaeota archaeon]|nr:MAG: hypothetical protein EU548_06900 [Candidatus Lokiarchaeota archaeon]